MNDFARPGLGATELPPVNSDDNGKVLGVNNGAWDKVDAPSSGALVIEYSSSGTTTSKYQDLKDALESSTPVFVKILGSNGTSKLLPVRAQSTYQGSLAYNFQGITSVSFSSSTLSISVISVSANSNLNATLSSITTKTYSMSASVVS